MNRTTSGTGQRVCRRRTGARRWDHAAIATIVQITAPRRIAHAMPRAGRRSPQTRSPVISPLLILRARARDGSSSFHAAARGVSRWAPVSICAVEVRNAAGVFGCVALSSATRASEDLTKSSVRKVSRAETVLTDVIHPPTSPTPTTLKRDLRRPSPRPSYAGVSCGRRPLKRARSSLATNRRRNAETQYAPIFTGRLSV